MNQLIETLPAILKTAGALDEVVAAACIAAWKHAVGAGLSSHAVPLELRGQTLVVAVADNIWQRQLEQMRGQLLFRLNSVLGQPLVKSIELRVDPKTVARERARHAQPSGVQTDAQVPVELLNAASAIEDAELRRAFLGAASSCVRRLENPQSEIHNSNF
jgi:predicted nucleic acid-binding Zn ribbon protein